ncbi:hypothetical protein [Streptantibioticus ferralitis]|uniref:Uncharacterized protein n=1 Tax=Streptantibioticus ferralitis TaxID=236510 RepID=A0ABT5Z1S8_9ACTN|nr:hypothetical protein [Streptantibioticus ferralitis]MDF2257649.1 hypothetical protein [Streptantibioticus ferralitis]
MLLRLGVDLSDWGVAFVIKSDLRALFRADGGQADMYRLVTIVAARA